MNIMTSSPRTDTDRADVLSDSEVVDVLAEVLRVFARRGRIIREQSKSQENQVHRGGETVGK